MNRFGDKVEPEANLVKVIFSVNYSRPNLYVPVGYKCQVTLAIQSKCLSIVFFPLWVSSIHDVPLQSPGCVVIFDKVASKS